MLKKIIFLSIISLLMLNCGARKKEAVEKKSATKEETLKIADSASTTTTVIKVKEDSKNSIYSTTKEKEITVEPVDTNKESSYTDSNGKTHVFKNAKIVLKEKESNVISTSTLFKNTLDNMAIDTRKQSIENKTKKESVVSRDLFIDKKQFNISTAMWFLVFLIVAAIIAYALNRFNIIGNIGDLFSKREV